MANEMLKTGYGYGQVEPSRLGGQKGGLLPSQLPYGSKSGETVTYGSTLENGHFCKYDEVNGLAVDAGTADKEACMLVFCEEKRYDEKESGRKYFRLDASKSIGNKVYPRLVPVAVGDAYVTNYVSIGAKGSTWEVGDYVTITAGVPTYVAAASKGTGFILQVVAITTLPDGAPALKLMRVQ